PARGGRGRARAARPRAPALDRREVRRRSCRAEYALRGARRGAGHDRVRVRAVPPPARLHPANAARPDDHRPGPGAPRSRAAAGRRSAALLMPELWTPVPDLPHEAFVERLYKAIASFAEASGVEKPVVEVELSDTSRFVLEHIDPEPGFGMITLYVTGARDDAPDALIVPIGS